MLAASFVRFFNPSRLRDGDAAKKHARRRARLFEIEQELAKIAERERIPKKVTEYVKSSNRYLVKNAVTLDEVSRISKAADSQAYELRKALRNNQNPVILGLALEYALIFSEIVQEDEEAILVLLL